VTAVLVSPTTTTATGMLVTPTAIKGPEVTIANYSFGSAYPRVFSWVGVRSPTPRVTAFTACCRRRSPAYYAGQLVRRQPPRSAVGDWQQWTGSNGGS
jgi:hypothetical protein